uniref:Putative secreted protein n=1 Tax=Anopheles darlingi TaxID=43151 RepID=A0A2M4DA73_ANODA
MTIATRVRLVGVVCCLLARCYRCPERQYNNVRRVSIPSASQHTTFGGGNPEVYATAARQLYIQHTTRFRGVGEDYLLLSPSRGIVSNVLWICCHDSTRVVDHLFERSFRSSKEHRRTRDPFCCNYVLSSK